MDIKEFERSQIKLEIVCNDFTGASETDEFVRFSARGQNETDASSCEKNRLHQRFREQTDEKSMLNLESLYDRDMKPIKEEKEDVAINFLNLKMENVEVENILVKSDFCGVCNGKFNDEIDVTDYTTDGYQCFCKEYQESKPDYINHEDLSKECGLNEDPGVILCETAEDKITEKEQKDILKRNTPSTVIEKEFAIKNVKCEAVHERERSSELFNFKFCMNSVGGNNNYEEYKICSEYSNEKRNEGTDSEKKPFQCKLCSKAFSHNYLLKRHERSHTGEKPFQCKICSKAFTQNCLLKRHEKSHTGEKPFQCKICSMSFISSSNLKRHEIIHIEEKSFHCQICLKSFATNWSLQRHETTHTGEKPFQCKVCSISFISSSNLKRHEISHTGIKPFQCKTCSKSFIISNHLKNHEKNHTGERPFKCKICSKTFTQNYILKSHEKIHSGEKPFQCEICSKSFIKSSCLKKHEITHTGEKRFQCKICAKKFSQNYHMKVHEKIHSR